MSDAVRVEQVRVRALGFIDGKMGQDVRAICDALAAAADPERWDEFLAMRDRFIFGREDAA